MKKVSVVLGLALVAVGAQANIFEDYEGLTEGFLGSSFTNNGVTYRDVNAVTGFQPDGSPFTQADLGDQVIVEDASVFYNDFPGFGSPVNALTFGSSFVPGENLSIGALASVYMDIDQVSTAASFNIAYYENGPWGDIVYHLDAIDNGNVVASDSFTISNLGGRDNATYQTMSVSGASFTTLHLYATLNGDYVAPRGMIDNLNITTVPEPASLTALALGGLLLKRRKKA